jgi:2-dehydropantoate 2-reductase
MKRENARILVIGAGVNGSLCATRLHTAGFDVTVLARGQRYEEIRDAGIVIEDPMTKKRSVTRVPVINALEPQDTYDYILVVVRKNQVAALLPVLARNVSPNIVFMGNNLSGPGEYAAVLGKERVMLGFVFGAGRREGDVIRAWAPRGLISRVLATPFGEINGTITPRLTRLVAIFRWAGLHAAPSPAIVDYLTTHAVQVAVVARLIIKHGCDTSALAHSTADLRLLVDGLRETLDVLGVLGYRIIPRSTSMMRLIPRFLLVAAYRALFASKIGEVGAGWHCSQAPDEMQRLAEDLEALVEQSGLPVPAIRKILELDERDRSPSCRVNSLTG